MFLLSIFYGVFLGILYGCFRVFRKVMVHKDRFVHLEDILYCVIAAFGLFYIFHVYNDGIMRSYVLLGILIGAEAYFVFGSGIFEKILYKLSGILCFLLKKVFGWCVMPLQKSVIFLVKSLKKIGRTVRIVRSKI